MVVQPEEKTLTHKIEQPGEIHAFEQTPIYPKISAYVKKVYKDIDDPVAEGEVLADLSVPEMNVELKQKESLVTQAAAELQFAKDTVALDRPHLANSFPVVERHRCCFSTGAPSIRQPKTRRRPMATSNRAAIAALNGLIAACKDGESGYCTAAEKADGHEQVQTLFRSHMDQRARFAADLLNEVHRLDTVAERKRTAGGVINQGWMTLEAALPRHHLTALIAGCERGERSAVKRYEAALKKPMPAETRALLQKQCEEVRQAHHSLCRLKAIETLNDLVTVCKNGAAGYENATAEVDDADLKGLFQAFGRQRVEFGSKLLDAARALGDGEPAHGTAAAALHRGWMKVATAATHGRANRIIKECLRGERVALNHYDKALRQPLPVEIRELVLGQQGKIIEAQAKLQAVLLGPVNGRA